MVTRAFGTSEGQVNLRQTNQELTGLLSTVRTGVLPVLGLTAAFSLMGGGLNDATASGRAASGAMYQLQTSTYGLQEAITRLVVPALERVTPVLAGVIDQIVAADEATGGWSTGLGILGGAALLARGRIAGLFRALGGPAAARVIAGAGLGGAAVGSGAAGAGVAANQPFNPRDYLPPFPTLRPGETVPTARPGETPVPGEIRRGLQTRPPAQPQQIVTNYITIQAHDVDNGLRRVQEWIDNGALRFYPINP